MAVLQVLTLAGTLLLCADLARAQTTSAANASASDPFAAYHSSLTRATERALAPSALPPVQSPPAEASTGAERVSPTLIRGKGPIAAVSRVQQLRSVIEPILRQEQIPPKLVAIVLVESGGQPNALSPKGARGIWQFMPDTARRYGLIVTPARDERLDIERSTRAAARYLRDLHTQFGDWQLAVAAYNAGGDLVQHAIERNGTRDFSKLSSRSIPYETRKYVPAVFDAMEFFGRFEGAMASKKNVDPAWKIFANSQLSN